MITCLGKTCSFGLRYMPFVNFFQCVCVCVCLCVCVSFPFGFEGEKWDLMVVIPTF